VPKTPEKALLLINTAPTDSTKVISDLKKIEGVNEVYPLKGMYDVIAVVQADSFEKLKETIINRIRGISDVKATLTLTLIEEKNRQNNPNAQAAFRN
jgi:DNA-binding Lrp family transcriptional regulator